MLVSVICPTMPSRADWLVKAKACFESQDVTEKEFLTDDGAGTIGEKRNRLCALAQGEFIVHFDDDDHSALGRVYDQVNRLQESGKSVTGYHSMKFTDGSKWWKNANDYRWAYDATLCYRREFWQAHPFSEINDGLEATFRHAALQANQFIAVDAGEMMYATIHDANTSKRVIGQGWEEING